MALEFQLAVSGNWAPLKWFQILVGKAGLE